MDMHRETIGADLWVCVSARHTFGADALLLSRFATLGRAAWAVDLGAGCGAVGALLFEREEPPLSLHAVEIDPQAAALARETAKSPRIGGRMAVVEADLRRLEDRLPAAGFDLVVCNPPFFETERGRLSPDPARRTARSEALCTLGDVAKAAVRLLRPGGRLCVCQRPERLLDLCGCMRAVDIEPKRLALAAHAPDYAPFLCFVEGVKGGRPGLKVEPTHYHTDHGKER